jgi:Large polyvalent protein associated domain 37
LRWINPGEEQKLDWKENLLGKNDEKADLHNFRVLVDSVIKQVETALPETKEVYYDFERRGFYNLRTGSPVRGEVFEEASDTRAARAAKIGTGTIRQAIILKSILQGEHDRGRGIRILQALLDGDHLLHGAERAFYQEVGGGHDSRSGAAEEPLGSYDPETRTIALLKSANASTPYHETAHWTLDIYGKIAADPAASPELRADMDAILKWMGVRDRAAWQAMSLEERRPYHERFAKAFETYLLGPNVLQKAAAADGADQAPDGGDTPAADSSAQQTKAQAGGVHDKSPQALGNFMLPGSDPHDTLPADAPVAAGTMDAQRQKDAETATAPTPKFAVGEHMHHGVMAEGDSQGSRAYVVKVRGKNGATDLNTIAAETGYDYDQLKALNKISHGGVLKIRNGTKIILPTQSPNDNADANHIPVINIAKTIHKINEDREDDFTGNCGTHVFDAIEAGRLPGGKKLERTAYAAEAGPSLVKLGFRVVLNDSSGLANYTPRKGDVVVLQSYPAQMSKRTGRHIPAGHIAVFDGKYWVSDKRQDGVSRIWAGPGFEAANVGMKVYRP